MSSDCSQLRPSKYRSIISITQAHHTPPEEPAQSGRVAWGMATYSGPLAFVVGGSVLFVVGLYSEGKAHGRRAQSDGGLVT